MTYVHINRPRGHFIGQVRMYGHRRWTTVTGKCKTVEAAISTATRTKQAWHRIRVLFMDNTGWYEPHITFEGHR